MTDSGKIMKHKAGQPAPGSIQQATATGTSWQCSGNPNTVVQTGGVYDTAHFTVQPGQDQTSLQTADMHDIQPYEPNSQDNFLLKHGEKILLTTSFIERDGEVNDMVRVTYTIVQPESCTSGELIGTKGPKIKMMSITGGDTTVMSITGDNS